MQTVVILHLTFMLNLEFVARLAVFKHPTKSMLHLPRDLSMTLIDAFETSNVVRDPSLINKHLEEIPELYESIS